MSYTLIMRLAGPMQSWGVSSRFGIRETLAEPSKSGVIGLLCAALGWDRASETHLVAGQARNLADLASLPFGVRVVREGVIRRDYHTAQNVLRAKAKLKPGRPANPGDLQNTVLSERYYLSDAYFLVGLESDDEALLLAMNNALGHPHWPLCLGRKSFMTTWPVQFTTEPEGAGVVQLPLTEALLMAEDPVLVKLIRPEAATTIGKPSSSRFITDLVLAPDLIVNKIRLTMTRRSQRADVPLSFMPRRFAPREVTIYTATDYVPD